MESLGICSMDFRERDGIRVIVPCLLQKPNYHQLF